MIHAKTSQLASTVVDGHSCPVLYTLDAQCLRTESLLPSDGAHVGSFGDGSIMMDGWIHGMNPELLFGFHIRIERDYFGPGIQLLWVFQ
jgi:hypothetical protein